MKQFSNNISSKNINMDQDSRIEDLEQENRLLKEQLKEIRLSAAASQIRPHFLYNSLGVIQELCKEDPRKAEQAMETLAEILKESMQVFTPDKVVPFEQELNLTKRYLEIEYLRFEDQLTVIYEIAEDDFFLPPLTLQPIVENAVRYGVRKMEDGGTIWIRTRKNEGFYEVTVEDNGPGFQMAPMKCDGTPEFCQNPIKSDEGMHLGLKNVRERLLNLCDGELLIESDGGKGTCVTIRIPKD